MDNNEGNLTIIKIHISHYPEANVEDNGKDIRNNGELSFAPGEGHHPPKILEEKEWDIKSWTLLLPDEGRLD